MNAGTPLNDDERPRLLTQQAPWPTELEDLVNGCTYRPGWRITLWTNYPRDVDYFDGVPVMTVGKGATLDILTKTIDTYDPSRESRVHHLFIVPAATYNRASWQRWLFERFLDVETHEAMEFFQVDDERPYAPTHGPGDDPYVVHDYAADLQRRTSFRGEVNPD